MPRAEVSMSGNEMRILSAALQFTLIFGLVACSSSDREKAKEEAREDGRKASEEAKKAGQEIKKDAKELSSQARAAVQPGGAASEGAAHAEAEAKDAAAKANVHLDHAALLARVKTKLASDAGLATLKNVHVSAKGTVVTLSGTVANEYQKRAAVIAASQAEGVTRVEDSLTVQN
jgi:BON domain